MLSFGYFEKHKRITKFSKMENFINQQLRKVIRNLMLKLLHAINISSIFVS